MSPGQTLGLSKAHGTRRDTTLTPSAWRLREAQWASSPHATKTLEICKTPCDDNNTSIAPGRRADAGNTQQHLDDITSGAWNCSHTGVCHVRLCRAARKTTTTIHRRRLHRQQRAAHRHQSNGRHCCCRHEAFVPLSAGSALVEDQARTLRVAHNNSSR